MNRITVQKFLDTEVVDFASYSTIRAIASYIDGFKNSHRKVAYVTKYMNNKETKVSILSGEIMAKSQYLHGDISGSIISIAQNFSGSNNIPLLTREGNFGTRFTPEASATRYIFTNKEKYFNLILNPEDDSILIEQSFEGDIIEPRFFVPTLPLLLCNGSEGIATGFAQKILPRNYKDIIKYIKAKLSNKKTPEVIPYFNNFNGTIKHDNSNQFIIEGTFKRVSKNRILITEIPIGYSLDSYTKVLDKLQDNGLIRKYTDKSEDDKFIFEVQFDLKYLSKATDDNILDIMKLKKKISENYTCIDENNKIKIFNNIYEILDAYIKIKLLYINKRKQYKIKKYTEKISELEDRIKFIKAVVQEKLIINKQKIETIIKNAKELGINNTENHLKMQVQSFTLEKLKELNIEIVTKKSELNELKKLLDYDIWMNDISNLVKGLK